MTSLIELKDMNGRGLWGVKFELDRIIARLQDDNPELASELAELNEIIDLSMHNSRWVMASMSRDRHRAYAALQEVVYGQPEDDYAPEGGG